VKGAVVGFSAIADESAGQGRKRGWCLYFTGSTYNRLVAFQTAPGSSMTRPVRSGGSGTFGALTSCVCGSGQKKPGVAPLFQIIH
jgi:hypothetical protein